LDKVKSLRQWIDNKGDGRIQIMVDGGINKKTAQECLDAGTDVLVAGSFLFNHPVSLHQGVQDLLSHTSQID
jgi:ribulose-phosphate 3-epimerase